MNVGANVGYYCLLAQGQGVRTIAFEPDSMNCELLIRNMGNNGFDGNVVLFPVAVGDVPGFADIHGRMSTVTLGQIAKRHVHAEEGFRSFDWMTRSWAMTGQRAGFWFSSMWRVGKPMYLNGAKRMLALDPKPVWIIEVQPSEHFEGGSTGLGPGRFVSDASGRISLLPYRSRRKTPRSS